jgi:hypothetical protein
VLAVAAAQERLHPLVLVACQQPADVARAAVRAWVAFKE